MLTNGLRRTVAIIHLLSTLLTVLYAAVAAIGGAEFSAIAQVVLVAVLFIHSSAAAVLYSGRPWPSTRSFIDAILGRSHDNKEDDHS